MQQWPPLQKTVVPVDEDDDEDATGINLEAAKERLRREDREFDKKEYSRKIKEKHRVSPNTFHFLTYTVTISSLTAWLVQSSLRDILIYDICIRCSLRSDLQCVLKIYSLLYISAILLKLIQLLFPHQAVEETLVKKRKHKQAFTGIQTSCSDFAEGPWQYLNTALNLLGLDEINTSLLDLEIPPPPLLLAELLKFSGWMRMVVI